MELMERSRGYVAGVAVRSHVSATDWKVAYSGLTWRRKKLMVENERMVSVRWKVARGDPWGFSSLDFQGRIALK